MSEHRKIYQFNIPAFLLFLVPLIISSCNFTDKKNHEVIWGRYLNHADSVSYVGKEACRECHLQNYTTYLTTGMGLSFDTANPTKSASVIGPDSILYDAYKDLYYQPFWKGDTMKIREFRKLNGKVVYERIETVNYVVGSGDHTNSHMYRSGDYVYQVPFTYYTQKGMFDFPPGFEDSTNSRFMRKVGLECMSCHNGYPDFVLGSENKYNRIPDGIDCERCHGPGALHVSLMKAEKLVDTSRYPDFSIVNPGRLDMELQNDLCARCHLQGTMVLKPGKNFYDFKPGMKLSDFIEIFMPLIEGGKEDFIMASHYERMSQSRCFIESGRGFSCINCHNPHITHKATPAKKYNRLCFSCHSNKEKICKEAGSSLENNCISCHMRESGSRDIHHVTIHDHKISKPPTSEKLNGKRIFKGLISVNNRQTDALTMARGYLQEFESFHPDPAYLDSAKYYLDKNGIINEQYLFNATINFYFLKHNYDGLIGLVESNGLMHVLDSLLQTQDFSNYDAWTAYRIGQSFENKGKLLEADYFLKRSSDLAPFSLEFQNSYGALLIKSGKIDEAGNTFKFIINEDSKFAAARVNLAYIYKVKHMDELAQKELEAVLKLDPDNMQALVNLASIYFKNEEQLKQKELLIQIELLKEE